MGIKMRAWHTRSAKMYEVYGMSNMTTDTWEGLSVECCIPSGLTRLEVFQYLYPDRTMTEDLLEIIDFRDWKPFELPRYILSRRDVVLMECIPVHDMNGRPIFQEDYVEISSLDGSAKYYRVIDSCVSLENEEGYCSIVLDTVTPQPGKSGHLIHRDTFSNLCSSIKVIGNLFENPELLKCDGEKAE